jgi:type IV pilus assembly protein PilW
MSTIFSLISRKRGFSLVELMIAMVLGLFLIGGVVSVFLANRQVYRQNENLGRMQENARYAFEIVGRDVREAGGIVCGSKFTPTNTISNPSTNWWSSWNDGTKNTNGIRGFEGKQSDEDFPQAFGTAAASRVEGADDDTTPDALITQSASGNTFGITAHDPTGTHNFTLNTTGHGFSIGDAIMACDYTKAALFTITGPSGSNPISGNQIEHATTVLQTLIFQSGGQLARLSASAWYIGFNGRGGRSLYRVPLGGNSEEIAEGVTDLQIQYLVKDVNNNLPDSYVDADNITTPDEWKRVVAVRIVFTLSSLEAVGTGNVALTRNWNTVVTLRNR